VVAHTLLLSALACSRPDADALFRAHDYAAAEAAWEAEHGEAIHLSETISDVILLRDPRATVTEAAPLVRAWRLLEDAPVRSRMELEEPFETFGGLIDGARRAAAHPLELVVGRSEARSDGDPYLAGSPLPFAGGRIHGLQTWHTAPVPGNDTNARRDDLPARIDANPPARLLTVALRDASGALYLWAEHTPDGWMLKAASSFAAADRVLRAMKRLDGYAAGADGQLPPEAHKGLRPNVALP
jgi:hypothetical protein